VSAARACAAAALRGLAFIVAVAAPLRAFDLTGRVWPNGEIPLTLALGAPAAPLLDGATDFNTLAESALAEWNQHMERSRFVATRNPDAVRADANRINNVFFSGTVYGSAWGSGVLAVTLSSFNAATGRTRESDVLFNSALTWNSYRGTLRSGIQDFRRVALHEFGHVLGLDHPDDASPPQSVAAVMNSRISSLDTLQSDDIAGARLLYDQASTTVPTIVAQPQGSTVRVGDSATIAVVATSPAAITYTWRFTPAGTTVAQLFPLVTGPTYRIGSVQPVDAGTYTVEVSGPASDPVRSSAATLAVTPLATTADTTLANISTRALVGTGGNVMIAGLVIGGTTPKTVFVRAAGPALADFGVSGTLANPTLGIVNSAGQTVAANDDWETQSAPGSAAAIRAAETRLGAFQFRAGSRDAALVVTLPPGSYTAVVNGANNTAGIALVEAYDADPDAATARTRKLVNIATRGQVVGGENVLIAGLVVSGPGPRTYLIRAVGPTLRRDFGLTTALLDPFLQLYRGETLLRENDDWDTPTSGQPALRQAAQKVGAFSLMETRDITLRSGLDAAMLVTLAPGSYTAKVTGFDNRTGVALIEIYEVD
jgi:hypothetical protein